MDNKEDSENQPDGVSGVSGVPQNRFYLVLIEPLLERPIYYALNKSPVTIGFTEECDLRFPRDVYGLLNFEFCYNPEGVKQEFLARNPRIILSYNKRFETWRLGPYANATMYQLAADGLVDGPEKRRMLLYTRGVLKDGISLFCKLGLFSDVSQDGLRLTFTDMNLHPKPDEKAPRPPLSLLTLPDTVLMRIGAQLNPIEYLDTLAYVSPIFTDDLRFNVSWDKVEIPCKLDGVRVSKLASVTALQTFGFIKPSTINAVRVEIAYAVRQVSRRLLSPTLDHWIINDTLTLSRVRQPPPMMTKVTLKITDTPLDWNAFREFTFPPSVQCMRIKVSLCTTVSLKMIFEIFPNLKRIFLDPYPCFSDEEFDIHAKKFTHLRINLNGRRVDLSKFPNVEMLQLGGYESEDAVVHAPLPFLTTVIVASDWKKPFAIRVISQNYPFIRVLGFTFLDVSEADFKILEESFPLLEVIRARHCKVADVNMIIKLLKSPQKKHMKHIFFKGTAPRVNMTSQEILQAVGEQYIHATLHWKHQRQLGEQDEFTFLCSKLSPRDRGNVSKLFGFISCSNT